MNNSISNNYVGVPHRANYKQQVKQVKQNVKENAGDIAAGGAVGTMTFSALKNSSKIGNSAVKIVQESKLIQASNKAKILKIFSKGKFLSHPAVKKLAGPLASFAALSTVVGSAAKVADTCNYLSSQNS